MSTLNTKIYLSDEGYGHIVRQRAILEELLKRQPELNVVLQTSNHYDFARQNVPASRFIKKFNNIQWHKEPDSSPDLKAIQQYYAHYLDLVSAYEEDEDVSSFDFLITDFVYEAFDLGARASIPVFGVSHFTWDWFFSKLYPRVMEDRLFDYFKHQADQATKLFFPPFTPKELLVHYKHNAQEVPFIIRSGIKHRSWPKIANLKVLIMDSGAGLLAPSIAKAIQSIRSDEITLGVLENIGHDADNIFAIPSDHLLVDYVKGADLVVGRPGFNTLSECIAYRVPMLLLSESMNPEMEHNIMELKKQRLGAFMSKEDFENRFDLFLSGFMKNEYNNLKAFMDGHSFETNGASVIADEILNNL